MSNADWIKAGVELLAAIISGVTVAVVVYLLDKRRAKREQQLSDYRIASNWFQTQPRMSLRGFDLTSRNLSAYKFVEANLEETLFTKSKCGMLISAWQTYASPSLIIPRSLVPSLLRPL